MLKKRGIIDYARNPFCCNDWISQGRGLTAHRQEQLSNTLGKTIEEIKQISRNEGSYPAFVAIRWGFAELRDNRRLPTERWSERYRYDQYGDVLSKVENNKLTRDVKDYLHKKTSENSLKQDSSLNQTNDIMSVEELHQEIERRRTRLISLARNSLVTMDRVERNHIIQYLYEGRLPERPTDEVRLMKEFVSSALSINQPPHRIRNRLKAIVGEIPLAETIPGCLHKLFDAPEFLLDNNWMPQALSLLSNSIRKKIFGTGDQFKDAVLTTIGSIANKMQHELSSGLDMFYSKVSEALTDGPEYTWSFMENFSSNIIGVGPVLLADFLKNIGFVEFVKIDQRIKNEFPKLIKGSQPKPKDMFIYTWRLCEQLRMSPFVFDHILYQWGNPRLKTLLNSST